MKKDKIFIIVGVVIFLIVILIFIMDHRKPRQKEKTFSFDNSSLMEYSAYKDIQLEDIEFIAVLGKDSSKKYRTSSDIERVYRFLASIQLNGETEEGCDDVVTYTLHMKNDKNKKIVLECDTVILNKKHYMIAQK